MERGVAMRWLLGVVIAAAVLWGGWWFAASTAMERGAVAAFDAMTARGLVATRSDLSVRGFPNRLDLTLTDPAVSNPATGLGYRAEFFQLYTLTWRPWHVIAAFAPEQRVTTPGGDAVLTSTRMQASLVLQPDTALGLDRMALAGDAVTLSVPAPENEVRIGAETVRFATRLDPTRDNTHEIGLDIAGLDAGLPPGTGLPPRAERLRIVAFAGFSAPLDRFAGETRPELLRLDLSEMSLIWGDFQLTADGALTVDAGGFAEGRISIRLDNWETALSAATAIGLVRPEIAPTWAELGRRLAEASGDPRQIDLPLTIAGGRMSLGPLPLGPAPRLR
jgi:hypothetical protein